MTDSPLEIACETCSSKAAVVMAGHADATGKKIEWPKAAVSDVDYFVRSAFGRPVAHRSDDLFLDFSYETVRPQA